MVNPIVNQLLDVVSEIARADVAHGPLPSSFDRCATILGEEYGEVCRAVLEYNRQVVRTNASMQPLYDELIQMAAVAVRWANSLNIKEEL